MNPLSTARCMLPLIITDVHFVPDDHCSVEQAPCGTRIFK